MSAIEITDVTLRDGLQMEARVFSTAEKIALFQKLLQCGYHRLEVTSFVNPKWVPQFADAEAFTAEALKALPKGGPALMAFVPNERGLERFLGLDIPWVSAFVAVTETFNKKNVNQTIAGTLEELGRVVSRARASKRRVRIYVSTVFGCPYEGVVSPAAVEPVLAKVAGLDPDEVALSDTIGVALPHAVTETVGRLKKHFPVERMALHLHDTYGLAVANALAGYESGVTKFDGSTGGVGGCPYAKGATGNVATELLAYAFFREGAASFRLSETHEALKALVASGIGIRSRIFEILEKGGDLYGVRG